MILFSLVNILAQSLAALLIFVVGYLLLMLCVIAGLGVADLIYKGARLVWFRAMEGPGPGDALSGKIAGVAHMVLCQAEIIRNRVAPARRSGA
jgi:hypothetical protein